MLKCCHEGSAFSATMGIILICGGKFGQGEYVSWKQGRFIKISGLALQTQSSACSKNWNLVSSS